MLPASGQLNALHVHHPEVDEAFAGALRNLPSLVILTMTDIVDKFVGPVQIPSAAPNFQPWLPNLRRIDMTR